MKKIFAWQMKRFTTSVDTFSKRIKIDDPNALGARTHRRLNASGVTAAQVTAAVNLFQEGATLPFIARYRKDATGSLDEKVLRDIERNLTEQQNLEDRKRAVLKVVEDPKIIKLIMNAETLVQVEDLYAPFKQSKSSRASKARALGLKPLANAMYSLTAERKNPHQYAMEFVKSSGLCIEDVLKGAEDIVADEFAHDVDVKEAARNQLMSKLHLTTKLKRGLDIGDEPQWLTQFSGSGIHLSSSRNFAINRAESKGLISVSFSLEPPSVEHRFLETFLAKRRNNRKWFPHCQSALKDAMSRLLIPFLGRELRKDIKQRIFKESIESYNKSLSDKLLSPPVRVTGNILGLDPAYKSGIKWAVISPACDVLATGIAPPALMGQRFTSIMVDHRIDLIAVGNGKGSQETENAVRLVIKENNCRYVIVDEAGASIYSASQVASDELPELDVSLRGAVSIARRVVDPLSELVKIDPSSIGVGFYQKDVDAGMLASELRNIVQICVSKVGVDVNRASQQLLSYVPGVNERIAKSIIRTRQAQKGFKNREELKGIKWFGAKTFENAAGFLRIYGSTQVLDQTTIHPESYSLAKLVQQKFKNIQTIPKSQVIQELKTEVEASPALLNDIIDALQNRNQDPREEMPAVSVFTSDNLQLAVQNPPLQLVNG